MVVREKASFQLASGEFGSLSGSDWAFGLSIAPFGDWPVKLARFFLALRFFTDDWPWRAARAYVGMLGMLLGSPRSKRLDEGLLHYWLAFTG